MKKSKSKLQTEEVNYSNIAYNELSKIPGYSLEALGKTFFYIKIKNYMNTGRDAFVRCTKMQYKKICDLNKTIEQQEYIYNEQILSESISFEEAEDSGMIVSQYVNDCLALDETSIINEVVTEAKLLAKDELDLRIIDCLLEGYNSDAEIATIVGAKKSVIHTRRSKLCKLFNEKLKGYKEKLYMQNAGHNADKL